MRRTAARPPGVLAAPPALPAPGGARLVSLLMVLEVLRQTEAAPAGSAFGRKSEAAAGNPL